MVPTLISPEYLEQNKALHEGNEIFGATSARYWENVAAVCRKVRTIDVLDYGCGKGGLVEALQQNGFRARGYDPAIEAYAAYPEPADLVVCTDVLEHIEPEYIEGVLDELDRLTRRAIFLIVATTPAKKTLPDGRNAHLIQKHSNEWLKDLMKRFTLVEFRDTGRGFIAVMGK